MKGKKERQRRDEFELSELTGAMMEWAIVFGVAAAIGIGAHLVIRAARLRWTWALPGLGIAVGLAIASIKAGFAVFVSSIAAAAIGWGWQRAALERGGEEAKLERERPGPVSLILARARNRRAREARVAGDHLALGETRARKIRTIPFGSLQGVRGMIVGAPGSGKTVTMGAICFAYVSAGLPVVCIDPKGDPALRDQLAAAAEAHGTRFIEWSPDGPTVYNPLSRGDATEIADKVLAGEEWSEPHYLRQAQRYLGWLIRALHATGTPVSLASVARFMDASRLEALSDQCPDELAEQLRAYLGSLSDRQRSDLGGVRDRLAVLAESELGRWLDPLTEDAAGRIDLAECWRERVVVYIRLDADRYPLAAEMLGQAIVSDLVSLTGELQRERSLGLVAIDEFGAIGARNVLRILSRSRSAGISLALATQGVADLADIATEGAPDGFVRRVLTQLDFAIAHRQPEPVTAEALAGLAGTRPVWVTTRRVDSRFGLSGSEGVGTRTREREFVCHPDEFKNLGTGEAIVIEPAARGGAERIRVWPAPVQSASHRRWRR